MLPATYERAIDRVAAALRAIAAADVDLARGHYGLTSRGDADAIDALFAELEDSQAAFFRVIAPAAIGPVEADDACAAMVNQAEANEAAATAGEEPLHEHDRRSYLGAIGAIRSC
jgi:hypothetical protein